MCLCVWEGGQQGRKGGIREQHEEVEGSTQGRGTETRGRTKLAGMWLKQESKLGMAQGKASELGKS